MCSFNVHVCPVCLFNVYSNLLMFFSADCQVRRSELHVWFEGVPAAMRWSENHRCIDTVTEVTSHDLRVLIFNVNLDLLSFVCNYFHCV